MGIPDWAVDEYGTSRCWRITDAMQQYVCQCGTTHKRLILCGEEKPTESDSTVSVQHFPKRTVLVQAAQ